MTRLTFEELQAVVLQVHPPSLSPGGHLLAGAARPTSTELMSGAPYETSTGAPQSTDGARVWVADLATGSVEWLPGQGRSWLPTWSPTGDAVAFWSDRDGAVRLWEWTPGEAEARKVSEVRVVTRPPVFWRDRPVWSADGSALLVTLAETEWPPRPEEAVAASSVTVEVAYSPAPPPTLDLAPRSNPYAPPSRLAWVDRADGSARQVSEALRIGTIAVSPDGSRIATLGYDLGAHGQYEQVIRVTQDDGTHVVARGLRPPRAEPQPPAPRFQPGTAALAWIREGTLEVLAPGSLEPRQVAAPVSFEERIAGWTADGAALCVETGTTAWSGAPATIWAVPLDGSPAVQVNAPRGSGRMRLLTDEAGVARELIALGMSEQSRQCQVWRLSTDTEPVLALSLRAGLTDTGCWTADGPLVTREDERTPPAYAVLGDSLEVSVSFNPDFDSSRLGCSQIVRWRTDDGTELTGSVLVPPTADNPLPVVVELYVGLSLSRFAYRWGGLAGIVPQQLLAAQGIAVFMPDIPGATPAIPPIGGIARFVLPGIDQLVRVGFADPDRIGVMGQSGGGICVNRIITETTRFTAAVSAASVANFTSFFGQHRSFPGIGPFFGGGTALVEPAMGGTPWEVPDAYIAESPLFHVARIETPLMLIHGTADHSCGVEQAGELFTALQRLGKTAVFLRYVDEDHAPAMFTRANRHDVTERVLAWWSDHLLTAR